MSFEWILVAAFGLVIGSFVNVCIVRLPADASVVSPGSMCPSCESRIAPRDNIPLLSFILLRARCRQCGTAISWMYPVVEAMMAVGLVGLYWRYGVRPAFFLNGLFFAALIALVFIDLRERLLPDRITLPGVVVGFLLSPLQDGALLGVTQGAVIPSYLSSAFGAVLGGGSLWLVATLYYKIRKFEGLGMGDVKMMLMVGAFLGLQLTWITIFLGSLLGSVVGGAFILLSGKGHFYELPYGSFLGLAAMVATLWGSTLVTLYFG